MGQVIGAALGSLLTVENFIFVNIGLFIGIIFGAIWNEWKSCDYGASSLYIPDGKRSGAFDADGQSSLDPTSADLSARF